MILFCYGYHYKLWICKQCSHWLQSLKHYYQRDPSVPWILMTYESANSVRERTSNWGRYPPLDKAGLHNTYLWLGILKKNIKNKMTCYKILMQPYSELSFEENVQQDNELETRLRYCGEFESLKVIFHCCKGSFQKRFSGFCLLRGYPPTPLTENHFSKKPLAEMGGTPTPPLTEKIR